MCWALHPSYFFFIKFLYLMILDMLGWFRALEGLPLPQSADFQKD